MPISENKKVLFICSQNRQRSLSAEKFFEGSPLYSVRSAGTQPGARIAVTEGHIGWADMIFCMETGHVERLRQRFSETLGQKQLVCLHIEDVYDLMQPELLDEFRAKLAPYLVLPEENRIT